MAVLKKGTPVRVKVFVPQGMVDRVQIANDTDVLYIVKYKDAQGNDQETAFHEDSLEVLEES